MQNEAVALFVYEAPANNMSTACERCLLPCTSSASQNHSQGCILPVFLVQRHNHLRSTIGDIIG